MSSILLVHEFPQFLAPRTLVPIRFVLKSWLLIRSLALLLQYINFHRSNLRDFLVSPIKYSSDVKPVLGNKKNVVKKKTYFGLYLSQSCQVEPQIASYEKKYCLLTYTRRRLCTPHGIHFTSQLVYFDVTQLETFVTLEVGRRTNKKVLHVGLPFAVWCGGGITTSAWNDMTDIRFVFVSGLGQGVECYWIYRRFRSSGFLDTNFKARLVLILG